MQVTVNQQTTHLQGATLADLVNELSLPDNGIAIAVNQQIVPRQLWDGSQLSHNDEVTVIRATRGG